MASTILLILDGWGERPPADDNGISLANTPTWDRLVARHPRMFIRTDGNAVGLPDGQMGNSEVGHMNIGAGRIVYQDFTRISLAADKQFADNGVLINAVKNTPTKTVHLLGLLSDGGVHSHEDHFFSLIKMALQQEVKKIVVHAFLDGRDTAPQAARASLEKLAEMSKEHPQIIVADISGRYYAMDRDKRWERTGAVYDLIRKGVGEFSASTAIAGLEAAYQRGETDEFVKTTVINPQPIQDGDALIFVNFRSDRARQLTQMFVEPNFSDYDVSDRPRFSSYVTMTQYREDFPVQVAFPPQVLQDTLGQVVSRAGLKQLRTAETEKYPHVTYFFNGGIETPNEGEIRKMIPSPKVATYDLQPEMSIDGVTEVLVDGINSDEYGLIVCNFANPDMVGHTGVIAAVIKACEAVDRSLARVLKAVEATHSSILITADHGNCEQLRDENTGQPHTSHTTNVVPLVYVGERKAHFVDTGALCDLAPTLLALMDLPQPEAMTGHNLLRFEK